MDIGLLFSKKKKLHVTTQEKKCSMKLGPNFSYYKKRIIPYII
jgi:hypothetical protein